MRHLKEVDADLRSIQAIQQAIRQRAAVTPRGEWVRGFKYDDTKTEEGRPLTREDLDDAAPDHPVLIVHRGGHSAYFNSKAIAAAKIPETIADPDGGQYRRDARGRLTGAAFERAMAPFAKASAIQYTAADWREGVRIISKLMTAPASPACTTPAADPNRSAPTRKRATKAASACASTASSATPRSTASSPPACARASATRGCAWAR